MTPDDRICEVVVTAADPAELAELTRGLVEARLVACGHHIEVIRSIYRWEGAVHDEPEARVNLHTRVALVDEIVAWLDARHPYDVPCVIALPVVAANPAYVEWVLAETIERSAPDALFADPRLAELYDVVDDDRSDLPVYAALVDELAASTVIDLGCGTGNLACLLARRGKRVVGVDPAAASLAVARRKPGADLVRWVHGDATAMSERSADLVVMTGNVAQVFLTDGSWSATLRAAHRALRPGGWLVFETRDPTRRAWTGWNPEATGRELRLPDGRLLRTWIELRSVELPLVAFRHHFDLGDGEVLTSDSTLRFRARDELDASLMAAGFEVRDVRDAPDRPGRELVYLARRAD